MGGDGILGFLLSHGSLALVAAVLVASGLGLPVPEDVTVLAAGALAHQQGLPLVLTVAVCIAGVLAGDMLLFTMARRLGDAATERRLFRKILPPERRARIEAFLERRGGLAIFVARHVAGLRAAVFAVAGMHGMSPWRFLLFDALAALVSVSLMVSLGFYASAHVGVIVAGAGRVEHYAMAALAVAVGVYAAVVGIRRLARGKNGGGDGAEAGTEGTRRGGEEDEGARPARHGRDAQNP